MNRPALITDFPELTVSQFTPASYSPDCLLDLDAIRGAIHTIFAGEFASEAEERGHTLPCGPGSSLDGWAPEQDDSIMLPFAWYLIGRVEQAWGHSVGLVFRHGGIESARDQEHALTDLFLGLTGSGVGLEDDFSEHLEKAAEVLLKWNRDSENPMTGPTDFDPRPYDEEMSPLRDLARAVWDLTDGGAVHLAGAADGKPACGAQGTAEHDFDYVTCPNCREREQG
jgi:hypothetical protein